MNTKDAFLNNANRRFVDVDDDEHLITLQPPAAAERVAEIEREIGFSLPVELRDLLELTAGIDLDDGRLDGIDVASVGHCAIAELFKWVITLTGDGAGNFWLIELHEGQTTLGPVWFLCHDAPVLIYQSADLATFVEDYLRYCAAPNDGPIDEVVRHAVRRVAAQTDDPPCTTLRGSPDRVLSKFARTLTDEWFIADLRNAQIGDGMPLARYGITTPLARAGNEFVFAYGSRSLWERLTGFFTGRR